MKIRHERVRRFGVDAFGVADLLDDALVHHHDPVAHHERFGLIVRDVDRGDAHVVLQAGEFDAHLLAQLGVEVAQGLVEEHDLGVVDDGAGEGDALALPAGELGGVSLGEMAQTHEVERLRRFLLDGGPGFAPDPQAVGHVVEDRHVRPDGVALEHHAQVSFFGRQENLVRHGGDVVSLDLDVAAVGMLEAGDAPERRGFSAA